MEEEDAEWRHILTMLIEDGKFSEAYTNYDEQYANEVSYLSQILWIIENGTFAESKKP